MNPKFSVVLGDHEWDSYQLEMAKLVPDNSLLHFLTRKKVF